MVVFDTKPISLPCAPPLGGLKATRPLGHGIALWFGCDDADGLHDHLKAQGVTIGFAPKERPFGRHFAFEDPFGYTITAHTVAQES